MELVTVGHAIVWGKSCSRAGGESQVLEGCDSGPVDLGGLKQMSESELSDFCDWLLAEVEPAWDLVVRDLREVGWREWCLDLPVDWDAVDREAGGRAG